MTATELAAVAKACADDLLGARILDVSLFAATDDVQLVVEAADGRRPRLLLALGRGRARVGATRRRFARAAFATGPKTDLLQRTLIDRTIAAFDQPAGDRRFALVLDDGHRLELELFGTRGLWALVDEAGVVVDASRPVATRQRTVRRGAPWVAPKAGRPPADPPVRFEGRGLDLLAAVEDWFGPRDEAAEVEAARADILRAATKAQRKLQHQRDGMAERLAAAALAPDLRLRADLMLAYAHTVARGATSMAVPAPSGDGEEVIELPLDPARPVHDQARTLYARARKLVEGEAETRDRCAAFEAQLAALAACGDDLDALAQWLTAHGFATAKGSPTVQQPARGAKGARGAAHQGRPAKGRSGKAGDPGFRRFESAEGYPILCGRNNAENDRLSVRTARGNDLWLHVGRQLAGSHVVVRVPKGKTPSLETLLDAGHVAVHFSKARGAPLAEVIYTQAKHVRKPKGLPPGAVLPSHTKTLSVRLDEARLRRVLDSAPGSAGSPAGDRAKRRDETS